MISPLPISQAIFPTAYFPSVAYLKLMLQFEIVAIEIFESYPKQTLRNRCTILTANGLQNLTVPVVKVNGNNTKTNDMLIFNDERWKQNHARTIESAYKSSPFYDHYFYHFEKIFQHKHEKLVALNAEILSVILKLLKTQTKFSFTTTYIKADASSNDFRIALNKGGKTPIKTYQHYYQVFSDRFNFQPNLSILDLLFNEGPNTLAILQSMEL